MWHCQKMERYKTDKDTDRIVKVIWKELIKMVFHSWYSASDKGIKKVTWDLRFLQECYWGFKSYGRWCCVVLDWLLVQVQALWSWTGSLCRCRCRHYDPSKFWEPLAQWHGITLQKTWIIKISADKNNGETYTVLGYLQTGYNEVHNHDERINVTENKFILQ
jgi:hypothetical protein